jgi:hypothetical protein
MKGTMDFGPIIPDVLPAMMKQKYENKNK